MVVLNESSSGVLAVPIGRAPDDRAFVHTDNDGNLVFKVKLESFTEDDIEAVSLGPYPDCRCVGERFFPACDGVVLLIGEEVPFREGDAVAVGLHILGFACSRRIGLGKRRDEGKHDSNEEGRHRPMLLTPIEESNVSRGAGRSVVVEWSEALQNFIIVESR